MEIMKIREHNEIADKAALWFHNKWEIPIAAYKESMLECMQNKKSVPQWYVAMENSQIIGGLGVIENDFHYRKDLAPNVCALYVEAEHRYKGIAGKLLSYVCEDMSSFGINTLYLITDHTSFYERYDWAFLCMVQSEDEPDMTRMYIHKSGKKI